MCEKTVAEMIIENLAAEAEAQGKYQPLIDKLKGLGNFEAAAEIEEIVSDICFSNFDCEGVVLEEETYKDLEMTSTTRGTLRVFLTNLPQNINMKNQQYSLFHERA